MDRTVQSIEDIYSLVPVFSTQKTISEVEAKPEMDQSLDDEPIQVRTQSPVKKLPMNPIDPDDWTGITSGLTSGYKIKYFRLDLDESDRGNVTVRSTFDRNSSIMTSNVMNDGIVTSQFDLEEIENLVPPIPTQGQGQGQFLKLIIIISLIISIT